MRIPVLSLSKPPPAVTLPANPLETIDSLGGPLHGGQDEPMTMILRLLKDERGATAIEYGLIAALISLACVIAFQMLGLNLADVFTTITNAMAGR